MAADKADLPMRKASGKMHHITAAIWAGTAKHIERRDGLPLGFRTFF
ncbi:MAG: hypothetical protein PHH26_01930 [Candidatus Thermoplasmatota archaeon]|nr:hypothetical protein [Candidatus Thermoplasmatota archaeon]